MSAAASTPRSLTPPQKARLIAEILASWVRTRRVVRRTDLKSVIAELRGGAPANSGRVSQAALVESGRLGAVVARVLGPLPVDSRCLTQSLVLSRLLARREIPSRLVIGVSPGEAFGAHAWVEVDGHPVLPTGDGQFSRLVEL